MEVDYASEANNTESKLEDGELKFHLTLWKIAFATYQGKIGWRTNH